MDPIGGHVRQTGRGMGLKLFVLVSLLLKSKFISVLPRFVQSIFLSVGLSLRISVSSAIHSRRS